MILRQRPGRLKLLFALRGSVLPAILPYITLFAAISALVVWVDKTLIELPHLSVSPFAVFGIALSLFLGFRNNAAYDRWWEGRKLWGQLVADIRALGVEADMFLSDEAQRRRVLRLALAFMHLHRCNLRGLGRDGPAASWIDDDALVTTAHPPSAALAAIGRELQGASASGQLDGFGHKQLSERLAAMAYAQAGAERIAATPLPFVYSLLIYRTSYLYMILLPLGLLEQAGWMTPLFSGIVAYVFLGFAEVSEDLSHPFAAKDNGLPLDAICRTCEISLAPHLGVEAAAPIKPENYVLT